MLQILAEVETARVNLHSHSAQILTLQREVAALQTTLKLSNEQFQAGLISQTNYLDTERRWLESVRSMAALKQAKLAAHINFIKALGGGEGF